METRARPYMFERHPALEGKVPWKSLGSFPTPVEKMENLGRRLSCDGLYIKRDDLSGKEYGGNKVRKLEFTLADAAAKGRGPVITAGAVGSNHVLATTIYAKKLGLDTVGIFLPQPVQEYLRTNILCNCMLGCRIEYVKSDAMAIPAALRIYVGEWLKNRRRPYLLGPGGSSTLGVLGYVEAAFEIARQVEEGVMPEPDYIFVPVGSAGTLAGLVLGVRLAGLSSTAVGVRVFDKSFANEKVAAFLARRAHGYLRKRDATVSGAEVSASDVVMLHDYFGEGYALFTEKGTRAIVLLQELEGIKLDGAYSGKAMAGFIDFMSEPGRRSQTGLFIDTYNSRPLDGILASCPGPEVLPAPVRDYFGSDIAPVRG